jgi:hypothetical protein
MSNAPFMVNEVHVTGLQLPERPPPGIAAFAIDSPRVGDSSVGAGIEISGWVIGREGPILGVRTVSAGNRARLYALEVLRPDVAADYPEFGHAALTGFSAWATAPNTATDWHFAVEAVLSDGESKPLAELSATISTVEQCGRLAGALPFTAPDFVIIGAQRGGTTSLHAYLSAHRNVLTPAKKELHYLTDRYERGRDWYLGQFPRSVPAGSITGEATPYALFHPLAPERLRQIAPKAKLIALLRNPVDRAYSHYLLERSRGFETLDFAAALDAEEDRLAGEEAKLALDLAYVSEAHKHASYLARGDYAPQLERWFAHVPREQILVLRSEDLFAQPEETTARVAAFLDLEPVVDFPFTVHNRSAGPRLEPALRTRLNAHFAPRNSRLEQLLGWNPGWN